MLQGVKTCYRRLEGMTGRSRRLQVVTGGSCRGLKGVTKGY